LVLKAVWCLDKDTSIQCVRRCFERLGLMSSDSSGEWGIDACTAQLQGPTMSYYKTQTRVDMPSHMVHCAALERFEISLKMSLIARCTRPLQLPHRPNLSLPIDVGL